MDSPHDVDAARVDRLVSQRSVFRSEALGCLHVIRMYSKQVQRWHDASPQHTTEAAAKIEAYGKKLHVLLGGDPPQTHGEAVSMQDLPECEGHEYDNRTTEENRTWLLSAWGLAD